MAEGARGTAAGRPPEAAPSFSQPVPGAPERAMAVAVGRALAVIAVPLLVGAWWGAGVPGLLGAAVGIGFVAVLSVGSAAVLARAVARGSGGALGPLVGSAFARLLLYAAALAALSGVEGLHRASLAIATAVAVTITLAYELRWLSRRPELFRVETATTRSHHP